MSYAGASAIVLLLGTCDTKLQELLILKEQIRLQDSVDAILVDVGRDNVQHKAIDITQATLIKEHGEGKTPADLPRGELIKFMAACASRAVTQLFDEGKIHGIISAGGSGGTSLAGNVLPMLSLSGTCDTTTLSESNSTPSEGVSLTISQPR